MVEIKITCILCNKPKTVTVTQDEYDRLNNRFKTGEFIQNILPNHSADDRELLISAVCGDCLDDMLQNEE